MAIAIVIVVAAAAALGAWAIFGGGGGGKPKKPAVAPATTTTTRYIVVAVAPEAGGINTIFNLVGVGFTPGDDVTFVIEFPNGIRFPGQPHVVAQNATVIATYKATQGNPPGDYVVRATSTRNETATGKFTVLGPGGTTPASGATTPTSGGSTVFTTSSTSASSRSSTTTTTRR